MDPQIPNVRWLSALQMYAWRDPNSVRTETVTWEHKTGKHSFIVPFANYQFFNTLAELEAFLKERN